MEALTEKTSIVSTIDHDHAILERWSTGDSYLCCVSQGLMKLEAT